MNLNAAMNGAMGGAAATLASQYLGPTYGPAAGLMAVGWFRKDPTLQTLAGVSLGAQLAGNLALPGGTPVSGGTGVL